MKEIFDLYFRRIVLFCNSLLKNMEDAEDIAVETFVELYLHDYKLKTKEQAKAYLLLVSKRKCLNLLKKKKLTTCELTNDIIDYAEINAIVIEKLYQQILQEVEHLPWRQKQVSKMFLFGLTTEEIAIKLGISCKSVLNMKSKATNTLRLNLKGFMKEYVYLD